MIPFPVDEWSRLPLLWPWLFLTAGLLVLTNAPVAGRIKGVQLQIAGTRAKAAALLARWGDDGRRRARLSIWIDFGFLVAYSTTLALACAAVAEASRTASEWRASLGLWLAWGQWAAGLLDAVENLAMLRMLDERNGGDPGLLAPLVATVCAVLKYLLVSLGALYAIVAGFIACGPEGPVVALATLAVVGFALWSDTALKAGVTPATAA